MSDHPDPIEEFRRDLNEGYQAHNNKRLTAVLAAYDAKCAEVERLRGERDEAVKILGQAQIELTESETELDTANAQNVVLREALVMFRHPSDAPKNDIPPTEWFENRDRIADQALSTTSDNPIEKRLREAESRLKEYETQWIDMSNTIGTCAQRLREAESKLEMVSKVFSNWPPENWGLFHTWRESFIAPPTKPTGEVKSE